MSNGSGNNNLTVADVGPSYEVIQCRACDVIVGDSSEYLHHDPDSATITLRSALSVSIDNKKRFDDNSAVFYNCSCTKCGALLGRVYRTTAAGQDHLRDTFTFDAVKLKTHMWGNYGSDAINLSKDAPNITQTVYGDLVPQIKKMQQMILIFHERIQALEAMAASKK